MQRVLVPYDQSEQADYALEHALALDGSPEIVLLHVLELQGDYEVVTGEQSQQPRQVDTAEAMLSGVREALDDPARVETAVRFGRPAHATLAVVDEQGIDHVVVGSHGRDGATRLLLGSVAETVARRSPVPVTVVRTEPDPEPAANVLVPFDGSTHSRHALTHALEQFPDAEVTALYVAYPPTEHVRDAGRFDLSEDWTDEREDHTDSVLDVARSVASERDRDIGTQTAAGDPADSIVAYTEAEPVDHVVVGSSGRDGLSRLLLGSVAETVVRRSPVSVTLVN